MVRAPFYDKSSGLRKGAWSVEEDNKLIAYIQRHGHWNWRALPKYAGISRCGKSCRLRWKNYLRPGVKRGNYTQEEDDLIIKLHQQFGNKWSVIAARLAGRTDNEIKNHWHTIIKKNIMANQQNPTISSENDQLEADEQSNHIKDASNSVHGQILESSPLSPESETELVSSEHNIIHEDSLAQAASSSETLSEFDQSTRSSTGGDFWSEPFIVQEDTSISSNYPAPYLSSWDWDPEGIIIMSPVRSYSYVSLYDNIDHGMDL